MSAPSPAPSPWSAPQGATADPVAWGEPQPPGALLGGPFGAPPEAPAATAVRQDALREVRAGAVTAVLVVLLGAPLGLLWAAMRPRLDYAMLAVQQSGYTAQLVSDLRLLLITAVAGLLAGLVAGVLTRRHRIGVVVGLAVGGVLAVALAAWVGHQAASPDRLAADVTTSFKAAGFDFTRVTGSDRTDFLDTVAFRQRARSTDLGMPVAACGVFSLVLWRRERRARSRHALPAATYVP